MQTNVDVFEALRQGSHGGYEGHTVAPILEAPSWISQSRVDPRNAEGRGRPRPICARLVRVARIEHEAGRVLYGVACVLQGVRGDADAKKTETELSNAPGKRGTHQLS